MKKILGALALAAGTLAGPVSAQTAEDPAFTAKLRASLQAHPEIIQEAMQFTQNQQREQQMKQYTDKIGPLRSSLFAKPAFAPVLGNPNGTVTVVEYLDYACPFCKQAHTAVDNIIARRKEVRVIVAQRPILGPDSEKLARFALAADLQGKFRQTHDALYDKFGDDHQTKATDEALKDIAAKVGLDYARLQRDMNGQQVSDSLKKQTDYANQIGIAGTPFFITSDAVYPGAAPEEVMDRAFR